MKKYFFLAFTFLFVLSCSRDDNDGEDIQKDCKIITAKILNYQFDDVQNSTVYNPNYLEKFSFEYDTQNRINKVIGGLVAANPGQLGGFYLSAISYDEITYSGNTVSLKVSANMTQRPYDKEFVIENGKVLSKKITSKYPFLNSDPVIYTYEYSGNQILEKSNNRLTKTFTIENGNLTKVIKWKSDQNGNVTGKTEIIFSDYDNQENLLKGKFFINGAFYMAFSKNIYKKIDSKSYDLENGIYVFNGNYFNTTYNSSATSDYFEKNCN